jgi:parvulin-like peptidyl-prolyl isomerase
MAEGGNLMANIPIEQAMVAIQQAKMAMQQGLIYADEQHYLQVEEQLQYAQNLIIDAKQKATANEEQLLEQANVTLLKTMEEVHQKKLPPNLQNG